MNPEKTLIVVVGPTAVGKTAFSIALAQKFGAEILSADSRQIFREMSIGTAKPTPEQLASVQHYFINSHSIKEEYDAARYGSEALQLVQELFKSHQTVILCGGSGLYIKAVCEGFDAIPEIPEHIREELVSQYEAQGIEWLQQKMSELDPVHLNAIDKQNPHRLMRALEVRIGTGKSISTFQKKEKLKHNFTILKIGLTLDREELCNRIHNRIDEMIAAGLFAEAKALYPYKSHNALQTVGYQEIFDFIDGKYDYDEAVRLLKRNSRRYAKRQLTWFKRDPDVTWFDARFPEEAFKSIKLKA